MPDTNLSIVDALGSSLGEIRRGIEKESLRVNSKGNLAQTPHPKSLGACLTHPQITTDFSEAQMELITGVHESIDTMLGEMDEIHRFVDQELSEELLWSASMPCMLEDDHIPVGQYGTSNIAQLKTVYRRGLGLRYGRPMQTISGIHFNFSMSDAFWQTLLRIENSTLSLQDFKTCKNFGLIRNFNRRSWLLLYLLGASPAICKTFRPGGAHDLAQLDEGTLFKEYATSLRMGGLGYRSEAQAQLQVSFNALESYGQSLKEGLTRPYPPYEAAGIQSSDGTYQQLATSLLQIENEFYSAIRPKRTTNSGERPLNALVERGIEYVEVRLLDVNPFMRLGIDANTIRLLDVFLLQCLLLDSPPDSPGEILNQADNWEQVVENGRALKLRLKDEAGQEQWASDMAQAIFSDCLPIAQALDSIKKTRDYTENLAWHKKLLKHPEKTPSGQIISCMEERKVPFFRFVMDQSIEHSKHFKSRPLSEETLTEMRLRAEKSHADQRNIEAADNESFEAFRRRFVEQPLYV